MRLAPLTVSILLGGMILSCCSINLHTTQQSNQDHFSPASEASILDNGRPICSGVLLDKQKVLTAAHCVRGNKIIQVSCAGKKFLAEPAMVNTDTDLAVLKLDKPCDGIPAKIASEIPRPGDTVFAVGCPVGRCGTVSRGVISDLETQAGVLFLVTDASIFFGSSGGALYNDRGELIGICSSVLATMRPPFTFKLGFFSSIKNL